MNEWCVAVDTQLQASVQPLPIMATAVTMTKRRAGRKDPSFSQAVWNKLPTLAQLWRERKREEKE